MLIIHTINSEATLQQLGEAQTHILEQVQIAAHREIILQFFLELKRLLHTTFFNSISNASFTVYEDIHTSVILQLEIEGGWLSVLRDKYVYSANMLSKVDWMATAKKRAKAAIPYIFGAAIIGLVCEFGFRACISHGCGVAASIVNYCVGFIGSA